MSAGSGRGLLFGSLLVSSALATSCGGDDRTAHPLAPDRPTSGTTVTGKPADPADVGAGHVDGPPLPPLVDRPGAYDPADTGPVDISVTVTDEPAFAGVKADLAGARAPIRFEAAGYDAGGAVTNGTIELRGSTTRSAPQKSYQIKLSAGAAPWRGSRTVNLLKHPFDLTRVRNTLSFELLRRITGFTSLRTGFVHLFIDAVDQGLYEWVEEPDENFLTARGLNAGGALYKAKNFPFAPINDETASDPAKVAAIIAAKARPDLAKLRRMLAAVNDTRQPIDDVVANYFNRDNYVTWLAVNVLMADYDSTHQNFMLYSPPGFEGWYFLPWDYDGAWEWNDQPGAQRLPRSREGVANWWSVVLHRRFLSEPHNLAELTTRVSELASTTISDAESARVLARHHDLVKTFIGRPPDIDSLPCDQAGTAAAIGLWDAEYARIASSPGRSRDEFVATLDRPMPYWLYFPVNPSTASVTFTWSPSFQLHGAAIGYDIEVGRSADFEPAAVLAGTKGISEQTFTTALPSGHYFWRVTARAATNPNNDWQQAVNGHLFVDVP
jgi:spore coat protein H